MDSNRSEVGAEAILEVGTHAIRESGAAPWEGLEHAVDIAPRRGAEWLAGRSRAAKERRRIVPARAGTVDDTVSPVRTPQARPLRRGDDAARGRRQTGGDAIGNPLGLDLQRVVGLADSGAQLQERRGGGLPHPTAARFRDAEAREQSERVVCRDVRSGRRRPSLLRRRRPRPVTCSARGCRPLRARRTRSRSRHCRSHVPVVRHTAPTGRPWAVAWIDSAAVDIVQVGPPPRLGVRLTLPVAR